MKPLRRCASVASVAPVVSVALLMVGQTARGQGVEEALDLATGSASVFTALNHNRVDLGDRTESTTEPSVGLAGTLAGDFNSGPNSLLLDYSGTVETRREESANQTTDSSWFSGASRFNHVGPGNRYDFGLGHTVRSVRNDTGFVTNLSSYDTQNVINAGAGVRFFPGDLSTLRISADASKGFGEGDLGDTTSYLAKAELERRLSNRSFAILTGSRSWADEENLDLIIDSAQLGYLINLDSGTFSIGAGVSEAESEFPNGAVTNSDAVIGYLNRTWIADQWTMSVSYDRSLSDSAIDQVVDVPRFGGPAELNVRLNDLSVTDAVDLRYTSRQLCDVCNFGLLLGGEARKSEFSGQTTHELRGGLDLGFQLTSLQRLEFSYLWQGETNEDAGVILEQVHRFDTRWSRQLAEETTFGVEFYQVYLRSRLDRADEEEFVLRLVLTHGFSMMSGR